MFETVTILQYSLSIIYLSLKRAASPELALRTTTRPRRWTELWLRSRPIERRNHCSPQELCTGKFQRRQIFGGEQETETH